MEKVRSFNAGTNDNNPIHAVGIMSMERFIDIVARVDIDHLHTSRNWIRERTSDTGNKIDVALAEKYRGQVVFHQKGLILAIEQ
ncbi:hypothetical protein ES708_30437 [subsurface metagenome]